MGKPSEGCKPCSAVIQVFLVAVWIFSCAGRESIRVLESGCGRQPMRVVQASRVGAVGKEKSEGIGEKLVGEISRTW